MLLRLSLCLLLLTPAHAQVPVDTYRILHTYPHSTQSYTEGLFYRNGLLYEGTGLEGHSGLLIYPLGATAPTHHVDLPAQLFGEGIIDVGNTLLQWTWQSHTGFVYEWTSRPPDPPTPPASFTTPAKAGASPRTPRELITSDGTATLRFRKPGTFAETHSILVHDGPTPIDQLNELEWIHGRNLRQHLALRPHRPHLPHRRPRPSLD